MTRTVAVGFMAFLVGLVGMLALEALHLRDTGLELLVIALVGVLAAVTGSSRAPMAFAGLILGVLASYPAALALGLMAFLGEEWQVALGIVLATATAGFVGYLAVAREVGTRRSRPV
jgi:hypothetical protein